MTRSAFFAPAVRPLRGTVVPPPDKSISHRAALLGAMGEGSLPVENYLDAADTRSTLAAVEALGASVERRDGELLIGGVGLRGARESARGSIDVGNAGTLLRLLPGWLAGQPDGRRWRLDGDESIRQRPVDRVAGPLRAMGGRLEAREGRLPPLEVTGAPLAGIDHELPVASAQVKSCVLLAGLLAEGTTRVREPHPSRDHTERMLAAAGAELGREDGWLAVSAAGELSLDRVRVPGDPSSAAFFVAAAALVPGSRLMIGPVGVNWTRTGFFRMAVRMGVLVEGDLEEPPSVPGGPPGPEPVATLEVAQAALGGIRVGGEEVPLAIDELPLVALLGCFAEGETVVSGARELRVKESDRIAGVVEGLRGLGGSLEATEDGFVVVGGGGLEGGRIEARGDHRLAMLGAVAGVASRRGVEVVGMEAAAVSYPGFERDLARLRSA